METQKIIYHLQDLVLQKQIKTFSKFYTELIPNFRTPHYVTLKFIYKELKNIHTFLKMVQHHPNSCLLTQALNPLFEFLLLNLVTPKIVYVLDDKFFNAYRMKYLDLIEASREKRIIQTEGDLFVIPYKGNVTEAERRRQGLISHKFWVCSFVSEKIIKKLNLTNLRYGVNFLANLSYEQKTELGHRATRNYFSSSDADIFFPLEMFDLPPINEN